MKRQVFLRGLMGAPIGVTIAVLITIIESAIANSIAGGGANVFYPLVPESIAFWGGELNAEICVFISSLLFGFMWGALSVIWEIPSWSLTRQTVVHLSIAASGTLAFMCANFLYSLGSVVEFVLWYLLWIGIYAAIWLFYWWRARRATKDVNKELKDQHTR